MPEKTQRTALVVKTKFLVDSVIEAPLVSAGYAVLIATNAEESSGFIDSEVIELALIDFRLQHAEPGGLVARLTERGIPFIFCTAASKSEILEHFLGARMMFKPFSDEEVLSAVSALSRARPPSRPVGIAQGGRRKGRHGSGNKMPASTFLSA